MQFERTTDLVPASAITDQNGFAALAEANQISRAGGITVFTQ